jgi:hypothetical protein
MEEQARASKVEASLKAATSSGGESNKLVELTKQNAILEVNLLKLTRKY